MLKDWKGFFWYDKINWDDIDCRVFITIPLSPFMLKGIKVMIKRDNGHTGDLPVILIFHVLLQYVDIFIIRGIKTFGELKRNVPIEMEITEKFAFWRYIGHFSGVLPYLLR